MVADVRANRSSNIVMNQAWNSSFTFGLVRVVLCYPH